MNHGIKESIGDIIEWDIANWSEAIKYWEKKIPQSFQEQRALELGARNGGLSLYLALKGCCVICSDFHGPTKTAWLKHQSHGIGSRVAYATIDATRISFPDKSFDIVAFKSILGGIGPDRRGTIILQKKVIREIHRVLKPGGVLLFAENLKGFFLHIFLRRIFIRWGKTWRYISINEMLDFMSDFSEIHYRTFGFFGAFFRNENLRKFIHGLDAVASHIVPPQFQYIIYGFARK